MRKEYMCRLLFYACVRAAQIGVCTQIKPRIDFGTFSDFCASSGKGLCNSSSLFSKRSISSWPHHLRATSASAGRNGQLWIRAEPALAAKVAEVYARGMRSEAFANVCVWVQTLPSFASRCVLNKTTPVGFEPTQGRPHRLSRLTL